MRIAWSPLLWAAIAVMACSTSAAYAGADEDTAYVQTNLVSDLAGAAVTDPNLKNAWGIAFAPGGPFWISDNATGLATVYDGLGSIIPLVVQIPGPAGSPAGFTATPTGMVWNGTQGFAVGPNATGPAAFIFSTEDGTISGWNSSVDAAHAILKVDNSAGGQGAVYKGLALAPNAKGVFLFATNFHAGTVDVFDNKFAPATLDGSFNDPAIPQGYAPFGIALIDGNLFVTYAQQDAQKHDDVAGQGHGFVDVFDTDGHLLRRFATRGLLNSPWGIARAPYGFGSASTDILIGNFGDGHISAFSSHGQFHGQLRDARHQPIAIDGLWSLQFGGARNSSPNTLYFTAGPNDEADGLFGTVTPAPRH